MTQTKKSSAENLEEAVAALRTAQPEAAAVEAAGDRVWQQLSQATEGGRMAGASFAFIRGCDDVRSLLPQYRAGQLPAARAQVIEAHLHECVACRGEAAGQRASSAMAPWQHELPRVTNDRFRWALAAAAVIVVGIAAYLIQDTFFSSPAGMRARVESLSGGLYRIGASGEQPLKAGDELAEGDSVRTAGLSRAMLRLGDGSLVEMNERAQFAVSMRHSDTTIQLDRGNIIVQAAKRKTGHLYVAAKDCRVAVTGTVFSVNSGIKGSRVSVIEGEVRVAGAGATKVLHPGDQLSTSASVAAVPVQREIAWSQNVDQHLALLAEFAHFANKLDTVQMPGLRYQSKLLPLLPGNTVFYASIPNLGDAAQQANQLFQQELQESPVLRQWWEQVQAKKHGPDFAEVLNEVHALGGYLGDEIVFTAAFDGQHHGSPLALAQVQKPGLKEFIAQEYPNQTNLRVVDEQELNGLSPQTEKGIVVLVRPDFVAAGPDVAALQLLDAALNQGNGGFAATPFGQRMTTAYQNGAGLLVGANLQAMAVQHISTVASHRNGQVFAQTGLADVQFLVAERKEVGGQPLNHAELSFTGPRHGMASWLAAPAPIGGLDFVSKDAAAVAAFVAKSPAKMLDDMLSVAYSSNANAQADLARGESELNIRFHQDLADTLGGEVTFALDGPILPTPSWKVIAEVYDPGRLQSTIQQLVNDLNQRVQQEHGQGHGVVLDHEVVNGLTYYTLRSQDATKQYEIDYTFSNGYIILGPSRALVMQALSIRNGGNSLARSGNFKALLPQDEHANVSALLYQNLSPVVSPIMQQLSPAQLQSLQQLAAETKPSVVCAYGEDNSIRVASTSRFFGLDLNTMALSTLLKLARPGGIPVH
jgi:ferric-dicitrate binding protein FerR (iron transport regulator)